MSTQLQLTNISVSVVTFKLVHFAESVSSCFQWFSEETVVISLNSKQQLVFTM